MFKFVKTQQEQHRGMTNAYDQLKAMALPKLAGEMGRHAENKHRGKFGTIIVEFFPTKAYETKALQKWDKQQKRNTA